ncbi:MAG TPA: hypothetical protein VG073_07075, partial [Gaiellaceae bacterium]|nr:hypothetical protein [Gaiellaceae bacterium]
RRSHAVPSSSRDVLRSSDSSHTHESAKEGWGFFPVDVVAFDLPAADLTDRSAHATSSRNGARAVEP